eukprot:GHVU01004306.1.p1 GENE.GHVU01004306.1~~GHVU01004306.1.p1  ORF type:complete len:158 (-),score=14.05 GHVU01004306.1:824-1297(-)
MSTPLYLSIYLSIYISICLSQSSMYLCGADTSDDAETSQEDQQSREDGQRSGTDRAKHHNRRGGGLARSSRSFAEHNKALRKSRRRRRDDPAFRDFRRIYVQLQGLRHVHCKEHCRRRSSAPRQPSGAPYGLAVETPNQPSRHSPCLSSSSSYGGCC